MSETAAILDTLGVALMQQERHDEAEPHLARAFAIAPSLTTPPFDSVRLHYAELLRSSDREEDAVEVEAGRIPTPPEADPATPDAEPSTPADAEPEAEAKSAAEADTGAFRGAAVAS